MGGSERGRPARCDLESAILPHVLRPQQVSPQECKIQGWAQVRLAPDLHIISPTRSLAFLPAPTTVAGYPTKHGG